MDSFVLIGVTDPVAADVVGAKEGRSVGCIARTHRAVRGREANTTVALGHSARATRRQNAPSVSAACRQSRRRGRRTVRHRRLDAPYLRTDNATLTFFRQRIAQLLSLRTASESLRLVAELHAVHDTWALVRSRSPAACVGDSVPVTMRETSQMGGKTHAAPPDHRPPAPLACDAPLRECRSEPPRVGVECGGPGGHSRG